MLTRFCLSFTICVREKLLLLRCKWRPFMEKTEVTVRPFGLRDKIGYMLGDCANDFTFMLSAIFMMKFYTDVMGVPAAVIGLMMMLAKVVDAFTDVFMGQICDRSQPTAKGKFLPWIRRFMGPVALASVLLYAVWLKNAPLAVKIVWMFATYILWGSVCYTGINIPYGSMASVISPEPKDRTSLSTFRSLGATVAATGIGTVLPMVVFYKNEAGQTVISGERMLGAAIVCSIIAVIAYSLCYTLTTERVRLPKIQSKFSLGIFAKTIVSSRALVGIIIAALLLVLCQGTLTGMNNYIFPNYFGSRAGISIATMLASCMIVFMSTFVGRISTFVGKKGVTVAGALIGAASMFSAFFVRTHSIPVWCCFYVFGYVGLACFNLLCWAMITDVIDDMEVKNGERNDGAVYSVYSFSRKLGQAASSGLTGFLLGLAGYTQTTAFDDAVVNKIYTIATVAPAISFSLLALALIFLYPLTKQKVRENARILKEKRG